MATGLDRALEQMEKVWDAIDKGKYDHDQVRERIASVAAAAAAVRAKVMQEQWGEKMKGQAGRAIGKE